MSNYYSLVRSEILELLPDSFSTVLEVGCGEGGTLEEIRKRHKDVNTIGVEINQNVANVTSHKVDTLLRMDIEVSCSELDIYTGRIDVLLLLDVLEHLRNPWLVLARLKMLLSPSAVVIASLPNVRSVKVVFPLVFKGEWKYQGSGILDRTHLRFFTKKSTLELFEDAGFIVNKITRSGPLKIKNIKSIKGLIVYCISLITFGVFKEFITHQYIIKASYKNKPNSK